MQAYLTPPPLLESCSCFYLENIYWVCTWVPCIKISKVVLDFQDLVAVQWEKADIDNHSIMWKRSSRAMDRWFWEQTLKKPLGQCFEASVTWHLWTNKYNTEAAWWRALVFFEPQNNLVTPILESNLKLRKDQRLSLKHILDSASMFIPSPSTISMPLKQG